MTSARTPADHYICKSIHEASANAADFSPVYEERLTLILAGSIAEAHQKAEHLVGNAVHSYRNVDGNTVTWTCKRIVQVVEIVDAALGDGSQIYARYFNDLDAYEHFERHGLQDRDTASAPGRSDPGPARES